MDDMTFVEKLELLRKARGLSQSDLAAAAGISQPRISEWKRGDSRGPTLPVALNIARALGVSLDYLADDAQEEPPATLNAAEQQAVIMTRALALTVDEVIHRLANTPAPPTYAKPGPEIEMPFPKPERSRQNAKREDKRPEPEGSPKRRS